MHAAGKTDQFKKDMERLREVKQRREKEAAERKAKDEGEFWESWVFSGFGKGEKADADVILFFRCFTTTLSFLPINSHSSPPVPCLSRRPSHAPRYLAAQSTEAKKEAEEKRQVRLAGKR